MNEESIFSRALELEIGSEREQFLDSACGNDLAQRRKIERLLAEHANPDSFLIRGGAAGDGEATESAPGQSIPTDSDRIGAYRLLHRLGEGGMGTVYLAEQQQPVRRRVAVKVIKQGMNTRQFIARFEAERQALAMMDHPNIAKVLDAGCTEDGRPYFVMELVKGIPITEFCDQNRLSTTQRLELFVHVCQAVQHAHQKGIIHRDLKPSNVLVAMYDNQPVPKVIDFGVAKATHQPLTEHTLCTIPGQIVGTWEYMSPEQAILNQLDVDTRTDIYSLGVILYELLTGKTPLDLKSLKPEALEERLRRIREEEPSRPSLRVSSLGQTAASMAAYRNTESDSLSRSLRGDLDWIVMKALDKDRSRRYETATGFATEINRYLNDEPLSFRPPSSIQRLRRFYRRNRSVAVTTLTIAAALVLCCICSIWGFANAQQARHKAETLNGQLQRTLTRLHEKLTGEALSLALVGNFEQAVICINEADSAGVDASTIAALHGMAHLYSLQRGSHDLAIKYFQESLEINRSSIAGATGLWLAHDQAGDYEYMSQARHQINGLVARTDLERFLVTQTTRHVAPVETLETLNGLIDRNPFWAAAYAFRGRARLQVVKLRYEYESTPADLNAAISDLEMAAKLAPASVFVAADYLMALIEAREFAIYRNDAASAKQWLKQATVVYMSLPPTDHKSGYTFRARTMYLSAMGDDKALEQIATSMVNLSSTPIWVKAAQHFAQGRNADFRNLIAQSSDKSGITEALRSILLFEEEGIDTASECASDLLFSNNVCEDVDVVALPTFLLFSDPDKCSQWARHLLSQKDLTNGPMFSHCLRYLADPTNAAEAELLRRAGPFSDTRHHAFFYIGMYALSQGNVEKSRACLDEVMQYGALDSYYRIWAHAFLKRMNGSDDKWPSWIKRTYVGELPTPILDSSSPE